MPSENDSPHLNRRRLIGGASIVAAASAAGGALFGMDHPRPEASATVHHTNYRVNVTDWGNPQEAIDNAPAGATVYFPPGVYDTSGPLVVSRANMSIELAGGASIRPSNASADTIRVTAPGVTIEGAGTILSPRAWTPGSGSPPYAIIHVKADNCTISGIHLVNVPRVGIYFDETTNIHITGVSITGNFPASRYDGTAATTGHFGICYNPSAAAAPNPRGVIDGNQIDSCVQGMFLANYGSKTSAGLVIASNTFSNCHNHGIYQSVGLNACSITGNMFSKCQVPIVTNGDGHAITGNTLYTLTTGSGEESVGINARDPINCAITGNTIRGAVSNAVINLTNEGGSGGSQIVSNTVTGNTIECTGGAGSIIRLGSANTTVITDNVISGNTLSGPGQQDLAGIVLNPPAGASSYSNKIAGNILVIRGKSQGILIQRSRNVSVQNNTIRYEYNAASTTETIACIDVNACSYSVVSGNDFMCTDGFGTNVALRGICETAAGTGNAYGPNNHYSGTGRLVSYTPLVLLKGSNTFVDERGPGVPAFFAARGSRWSRVDGGAGSSFYVKETDSSSNAWTAK